MSQLAELREIDPLLRPLLEERNEAEAERHLTRVLTEHASSTIRGIIRTKLRASLTSADWSERNQDALEIQNEVQARLLRELRALKDRSGPPLSDFKGYVAVVTYHACYEYLRRRNPHRARLKNRIRYLLNHRTEFALWQDAAGEWICGREEWSQQRASASAHRVLQRIIERPDEVLPAGLVRGAETSPVRSIELLRRIFAAAAGPVELDELVGGLADLWHLGEAISTSQTEEDDGGVEARLVDSSPSVSTRVEHRDYLKHLWSEVSQLPQRQCVALLLNLSDREGRDCVALLPMAGVATIRQIGELVGMNAERLAAVWSELPWDDARIAGHLGISRQQVINLRKSARERLARRMRALEETGRFRGEWPGSRAGR
ncbi:MAG: hypothetical protein HYX76_02890 [Acidobacteria bacterium]|nr:hypothetical protein [Acidobacteriota bacterium]